MRESSEMSLKRWQAKAKPEWIRVAIWWKHDTWLSSITVRGR